ARSRFATEASVAELCFEFAGFGCGLRLERLRHAGRGFFQEAGHASGTLAAAALASIASITTAARRIAEVVETGFGAGVLFIEQIEQRPSTAGHATKNGDLGEELHADQSCEC